MTRGPRIPDPVLASETELGIVQLAIIGDDTPRLATQANDPRLVQRGTAFPTDFMSVRNGTLFCRTDIAGNPIYRYDEDSATWIDMAAAGGDVATDAIWAALGDLAVGTGAGTASALTVGADGTSLVADSAEPTGLKWAAPAGGGDALTSGTLDQFADVTQTAGKTLAITDNTTLGGGSHSGSNTGDQTITLTGDVTGTGTGSFAATIAALAVTDSKVAVANKDGLAATPSMRTLGTTATSACAGNDSRLSDARTPTSHTHGASDLTSAGGSAVLGKPDAGGGACSEIGVGTTGLSLMGASSASAARTTLGLGTLATQSGTFSGTSSGTNTGDQTITLTGDVTGSGTGSFAATIAAGAVTAAKCATGVYAPRSAILRQDGHDALSASAVTGFTNNSCYAHYLGKADRAYSTITVMLQVTTACATITTAEIGIATGTLTIGAAATLTTRGSVDASGVWNSTGVKTHSISVSGINAGDDIWIVTSCNATTTAVFRAILPDYLGAGRLQIKATQRASLLSGTAMSIASTGASRCHYEWSGA